MSLPHLVLILADDLGWNMTGYSNMTGPFVSDPDGSRKKRDACPWLVANQCDHLGDGDRHAACACRVCPWAFEVHGMHCARDERPNELLLDHQHEASAPAPARAPSDASSDASAVPLDWEPPPALVASEAWQECRTGFGTRCCPPPAGFAGVPHAQQAQPCGWPVRGACVPIETWLASEPLGSACSWPLSFQAAKCRCRPGFAGPSCNGCAKGHSGAECARDAPAQQKQRVAKYHEMPEAALDAWADALEQAKSAPNAEEYYEMRMAHAVHAPLHFMAFGHEDHGWPFYSGFLPFHSLYFELVREYTRRAAGSPPNGAFVMPSFNPSDPRDRRRLDARTAAWCVPCSGVNESEIHWPHCCPTDYWAGLIPTQAQVDAIAALPDGDAPGADGAGGGGGGASSGAGGGGGGGGGDGGGGGGGGGSPRTRVAPAISPPIATAVAVARPAAHSGEPLAKLASPVELDGGGLQSC